MKSTHILILSFMILSGCSLGKKITMEDKAKIDFQGHRGCRGLLPENTIPAFIKALDYVSTLECDIVISKDKQVIVSHDPWIEASICSHPDGRPVTEVEEKTIRILDLSYAEVKTYDCGLRGNKRFPGQMPMAVFKPSMKDMVLEVDQYCNEHNLPLPWYDIEIKSLPSWYGKFTPEPKEYVSIVLAEIEDLGIAKRLNLQSFDINILEEIHKQNDQIILAYLIENLSTFEKNMTKLSFVPEIYSPYYRFVSKKLVDKAHAKGMKLIPWTVNEVKDMRKMINAGVDGIITDYPDRIGEL